EQPPDGRIADRAARRATHRAADRCGLRWRAL
ncbi:hypothetical protein GA0115259_103024, partial [Streptomyces sp. MnatMP-M17]